MDPNLQMNSFAKSLYITIAVKFKPILTFNNLIAQNLCDARINTRPGASNGLWCFALLPTVLTLYSLLYEVPQSYKLATCVSIGLLFYCTLLYLFLSGTSLALTEGSTGACLVSGILASSLVYYLVKQDALLLCCALLSALFFSALLRKLLLCANTFTIGEAIIVAQGIVIAIVVLLEKITCDLGDESTEGDLVNAVVTTVLSTVGLIVTALYSLNEVDRDMTSLAVILTAAIGVALVQVHLALGSTSVIKIITFLFMDLKRMKLLAFWLYLVLLAVVLLVWRTRVGLKATTVTRKSFHVLAAAVFASGTLLDLRLMEMAAGVGLGVLILVEALRKSGIEPISSALQSAFLVYSDEKDCGEFALTPIYMYCGLMAGLLAPGGAPPLERLSGVLAVGVGDAAASWLGSHYGAIKWPGQSRTMEGTMFYVLSQILTVYCLGLYDLMNCNHALLRTTVAATISGLVEANTDQVDNLILPLVTLIAFQSTYLIS